MTMTMTMTMKFAVVVVVVVVVVVFAPAPVFTQDLKLLIEPQTRLLLYLIWIDCLLRNS